LNIKAKVKSLSPHRTQSYAERVKINLQCLDAVAASSVWIVSSKVAFPLRNSAYFAVKVVDFDRILDPKEGYSYGD